MEGSVVDQLLQLNRSFYNRFAAEFADSRAQTEPGLERVLGQVGAGARVLDLGCGPARVAARLPPGCTYTGVDYSVELLELARERIADWPPARRRAVALLEADLVASSWPKIVGGAFDWAIMRATLQHIPGASHRRSLVQRAAETLAPDGRLVLANWQFVRLERLMRRAVSWDEIGLCASQVDGGDYLLDWRRGGTGLRYVHLVDEAETRSLAAAASLNVEDLFYADGTTDDLTLYAVLGRMAGP